MIVCLEQLVCRALPWSCKLMWEIQAKCGQRAQFLELGLELYLKETKWAVHAYFNIWLAALDWGCAGTSSLECLMMWLSVTLHSNLELWAEVSLSSPKLIWSGYFLIQTKSETRTYVEEKVYIILCSIKWWQYLNKDMFVSAIFT